MATRRRKRRRSASVGRPRSVARKAVNPRRRRRSRRRNPTVIVARRRHSRRAVSAAPRRRRRHSRRRNPSAFNIGQIFKTAVYGAGGAILTRTATSIGLGFVPGALTGNQFANPVAQALIAATLIHWGAKKFLGQTQADAMRAGGFISAGLALADAFLPNIQGQLTGIVRAPVSVAPPASLSDVYEVDGFNGLNDVYDVQGSEFVQFP